MMPCSSVPYYLWLKAQALYLANRTPEALEAIKEADAVVEKHEEYIMRCGLHLLRGVVGCFSRLWVLRRPKLKLHFRKPSKSQRSRSRFL
jgi:hypothetical protein